MQLTEAQARAIKRLVRGLTGLDYHYAHKASDEDIIVINLDNDSCEFLLAPALHPDDYLSLGDLRVIATIADQLEESEPGTDSAEPVRLTMIERRILRIEMALRKAGIEVNHL